MKRVLAALLLLCLLMGSAVAENAEDNERIRAWVQSSLTEVYNYTSDEADTFQTEVYALPNKWQVSYYPLSHPEWRYTADFDPHTDKFSAMASPFTNNVDMPAGLGENGLRAALRAAKQEGWFIQWDAASRERMGQWMTKWGTPPHAYFAGGFTGRELYCGKCTA